MSTFVGPWNCRFNILGWFFSCIWNFWIPIDILIVDSQLIWLYLAPICPLPAWPPPECRTVGDISSASACAKDLQDGERSNAGRGCAMHIQCISMCFIIIALYTIHVTHSVVRFASFYHLVSKLMFWTAKPWFVFINRRQIWLDWYYLQSLRCTVNLVQQFATQLWCCSCLFLYLLVLFELTTFLWTFSFFCTTGSLPYSLTPASHCACRWHHGHSHHPHAGSLRQHVGTHSLDGQQFWFHSLRRLPRTYLWHHCSQIAQDIVQVANAWRLLEQVPSVV